MNYTDNLKLKKPEGTDFYNVEDFNENADILEKYISDIDKIIAGGAVWNEDARYITAGSYTYTPDFTGKIGVLIVGGGGSGAAAKSSSAKYKVTGGASGYTNAIIMSVESGNSYSVIVGAGGDAVSYTSSSAGTVSGKDGGSSSFNGESADGGGGGYANTSNPYYNPTGASSGTSKADSAYGHANKLLVAYAAVDLTGNAPWQCHNPFTGEGMLAGGAGAYYDGSTRYVGEGGKGPDGIGGGSGSTTSPAEDGSDIGCGGGGILTSTISTTIVSGAGHDGAVIIYKLAKVEE